MLLYGWSFLAVAVVCVAIALTGYAGLHVFGMKVGAALFLLLSFFAFASAKQDAAR